ncbi:LPD29 domain-containing protein [Parabacteroides caeci]|uniref:LPD29 domain-containing protein n=1 Tax=Parabacteroides caeci TaxID=2949650 RepID=UPI003FCCF778
MKTTTYNTVLTIKRELNELSYSFFSDIVKKSPIKAVELEPGKWAFNDNEIGQGRNYFCDMFGYSLTQEEFEFEYFDDPQTLEDPEASESNKYEFYTQNGWAGSNYDPKLGAKEIAVKVRAFLKKEFPGFKFSVRSKWGMQSDTLYITILSGPIMGLCEGNPHNYESSISGFSDAYKGRITDEMLAVCEKINVFVSSYRYSDCDGMIDYFDTNFYCWIYIGDYDRPYKVVDSTVTGASSVSSSYVDSEISQVSNAIEIVDYSEKAIAIFGDTKEFKDQLKSLGGRFNPSLKHNDAKRAGWIFSKKQADKVRALFTEQKKTNDVAKRGKSLQDIIDQTRRLNGNAGRNWYWSFKREKIINDIYTTYVANIGKLGAYSEPNKKFSKEEYTGLIRELETKDTAPIEAAYEDSEISQKKGYYTKEENGYKVESYFTKDKTALEELIEINDQQSIRGMIEAKERAFFDASKNAEFYRSIGNDEFADTEQTRANRLKKDLDQLRRTLPADSIHPTGSDVDTEPLERVEVQTATYGDSEISQLSDLSDLSETARAAYRLQSQEPDKRGSETLDRHSRQITDDLNNISETDRADYAAKYRVLLIAWLNAMARVASPSVVGPASFPVKKNNKVLRLAERAADRLQEFRRKYPEKAKRKRSVT